MGKIVCASGGCNGHPEYQCGNCLEFFCEDCYEDFETDYDFDYSDDPPSMDPKEMCSQCY